MPYLRHRDWAALDAAVQCLYSHGALDALPARATAAARLLVDAEVVAYTELNLARQRSVSWTDRPSTEVAIARHLPIFDRYMLEHPMVRYFDEDPPRRIRTVRNDDLLSMAAWCASPLYAEYYRHIDSKYLMVSELPMPRPLMLGLAVGRPSRPFSDRECRLLDLLRPHLARAYRMAATTSDLRDRAGTLEAALGGLGHGLIVVTDRRRIRYATPNARAWIAGCFGWPRAEPDRLPPAVDTWLARQVVVMRRGGDGAAGVSPRPLVVGDRDGTLALAVLRDADPARFLVVVRRETHAASARALESLGLTPRQADVLYAVARGRTNAAIAADLRISVRTVHKHLERVFIALGVTSRTAAAAAAVACLRAPRPLG